MIGVIALYSLVLLSCFNVLLIVFAHLPFCSSQLLSVLALLAFIGGGRLQPSGGRLQPSVGRLQLSVGRLQPSVGRLQPSGGRLQPSVGSLQPSVGRLQPSGGRLQPRGGGLLPKDMELQLSDDGYLLSYNKYHNASSNCLYYT